MPMSPTSIPPPSRSSRDIPSLYGCHLCHRLLHHPLGIIRWSQVRPTRLQLVDSILNTRSPGREDCCRIFRGCNPILAWLFGQSCLLVQFQRFFGLALLPQSINFREGPGKHVRECCDAARRAARQAAQEEIGLTPKGRELLARQNSSQADDLSRVETCMIFRDIKEWVCLPLPQTHM